MSKERFLKELNQVAAGLFAGRQRGPDASTPLTSLSTPRALGDFAVKVAWVVKARQWLPLPLVR